MLYSYCKGETFSFLAKVFGNWALLGIKYLYPDTLVCYSYYLFRATKFISREVIEAFSIEPCRLVECMKDNSWVLIVFCISKIKIVNQPTNKLIKVPLLKFKLRYCGWLCLSLIERKHYYFSLVSFKLV